MSRNSKPLRPIDRDTEILSEWADADAVDRFASLALPAGTLLGDYRLEAVVNEDEQGIVYRATDLNLYTPVALKEYLPRRHAQRVGPRAVGARGPRHAHAFATGLRAFADEGRMLGALDVDCVLTVTQAWQDHGTAYRVMPWVQGTTLAARLAARPGPADETWLRSVLAPLLGGLQALHQRRHIHRRLTPARVFLTADSRVLLFGLRAMPGGMADPEPVPDEAALPGFAPIELFAPHLYAAAKAQVGPWTDLYSVGAMLHQAITGAPPALASGRLLHEEKPALAEVAAGAYNDAFLRAIDWALSVPAEMRPRNIDQFKARLGWVDAQAKPAVEPEVPTTRSRFNDRLGLQDVLAAVRPRKLFVCGFKGAVRPVWRPALSRGHSTDFANTEPTAFVHDWTTPVTRPESRLFEAPSSSDGFADTLIFDDASSALARSSPAASPVAPTPPVATIAVRPDRGETSHPQSPVREPFLPALPSSLGSVSGQVSPSGPEGRPTLAPAQRLPVSSLNLPGSQANAWLGIVVILMGLVVFTLWNAVQREPTTQPTSASPSDVTVLPAAADRSAVAPASVPAAFGPREEANPNALASPLVHGETGPMAVDNARATAPARRFGGAFEFSAPGLKAPLLSALRPGRRTEGRRVDLASASALERRCGVRFARLWWGDAPASTRKVRHICR